MVYSMTAFSKSGMDYVWGYASWEIRSLNGRYLDICIDLPKHLYELSIMIRKKVKSSLSRGKIECSLQFYTDEDQCNKIYINKSLISDLILHIRWIKEQINEGEVDLVSLLSYPGVLLKKNEAVYCINDDLLELFESALVQLIQSRKKEGLSLKEEIIKRLDLIDKEISKIQKFIPGIIHQKRVKLLDQINNFRIELDSTRLEQELFLMIQKIDISEEIDRLLIHIKEMRNLLFKTGPMGRQLDFIAQELQREANTLASKSVDMDINYSAISLKVFIDQIREQIQNIE